MSYAGCKMLIEALNIFFCIIIYTLCSISHHKNSISMTCMRWMMNDVSLHLNHLTFIVWIGRSCSVLDCHRHRCLWCFCYFVTMTFPPLLCTPYYSPCYQILRITRKEKQKKISNIKTEAILNLMYIINIQAFSLLIVYFVDFNRTNCRYFFSSFISNDVRDMWCTMYMLWHTVSCVNKLLSLLILK